MPTTDKTLRVLTVDDRVGAERRLPIDEARRIRNDRKSRTLNQAECEEAVCDGIIRFQEESMGWMSEQILVHFINDLLVVRIRGVLTLAEQQLSKSLATGKGRDLIKQVRKQLLKVARPMLESLVHEVAGVKVLSMHHDISTVTGEEVVLFSYRCLKAKGKRGDVALGHCMRKVLHLVFAVWKTGQPFDAQHYPWIQENDNPATEILVATTPNDRTVLVPEKMPILQLVDALKRSIAQALQSEEVPGQSQPKKNFASRRPEDPIAPRR